MRIIDILEDKIDELRGLGNIQKYHFIDVSDDTALQFDFSYFSESEHSDMFRDIISLNAFNVESVVQYAGKIFLIRRINGKKNNKDKKD